MYKMYKISKMTISMVLPVAFLAFFHSSALRYESFGGFFLSFWWFCWMLPMSNMMEEATIIIIKYIQITSLDSSSPPVAFSFSFCLFFPFLCCLIMFSTWCRHRISLNPSANFEICQDLELILDHFGNFTMKSSRK